MSIHPASPSQLKLYINLVLIIVLTIQQFGWVSVCVGGLASRRFKGT